MYPLIRWVVLGASGGLGANPQEFLIRSTGIWCLVALLMTLTITPLRRWANLAPLLQWRRMLGLYSFFYACLHIVGWALWEQGLSVGAMAQDVLQRDFILIGVLAFIPMIALAATSTRGWMRRLGRRWQQLHRSVYFIAIFSVWHFWLVRTGKQDFLEPYVYAAILAVLLLARLAWRLRPSQRA